MANEVRNVAIRRAQGFLDHVGAAQADIDIETLKAEMTRLYVIEQSHTIWDRVITRLQRTKPNLHQSLIELRAVVAKEGK